MPEENPAQPRPFTTFNFRVELTLDGQSNPLCDAAFAECDGLEVTMQPKTFQEGGNNGGQIHLVGPVTNGQLSLRRGMTDTFHLWTWFDDVLRRGQHGLRATGEVVMLASHRGGDGQETIRARFQLTRCLPVKIKAPSLNAKDGSVAIEEMQIAYERLELLLPEGNA